MRLIQGSQHKLYQGDIQARQLVHKDVNVRSTSYSLQSPPMVPVKPVEQRHVPPLAGHSRLVVPATPQLVVSVALVHTLPTFEVATDTEIRAEKNQKSKVQ